MFEERKFENIVNLEEGWEVLSSDNTFHEITHICKTVPYEIWNVRTIHHTLSCADNHILFDKDNHEIFVKDLSVGTLIQTSDGLEPVLCVYKTNKSNNMYDVQVDSSEHSYLTNGIKSHNTTVTTCFLLWYILFHDDKKCAILANKAMQAKEILARIQLGYIHLPKWLQVGVKSWGKNSIELENGSMLLAAATSSDSVRGFSFSCVFIDECAFIPKNIWEKFYTSTMPTISSGKESKLILVSCVTKDTMVFTPDGIKTVEDFIRKDKNGAYIVPEYTVLGKNGFNRGNIMVNSGLSKIVTIYSLHSRLKCSPNHKLWVYKDNKYMWCKAKDLKDGDLISIQYGMNIWGNHDTIDINNDVINLNSKLLYEYGKYIACYNDSDSKDLKKIIDILYPYTLYDYSYCNPFDVYDVLGKTRLCTIIPKQLLLMSRNNIIALLKGILDSSILEYGEKISFHFTSFPLMLQIQILLNNLGILSHYETLSFDNYYIGYKLNIDDVTFKIYEETFNQSNNETIHTSFGHIIFEPITKILNDDFHYDEVYDFSLYNDEDNEFSHSVVYNGIIGHQTPNGENHYYDFWTKAVDGKSNMVPYEVNWWDVPGRDEEWRKETLKNMSEDQFNVEYGNSFDSGSNTLISPYIFARLSKNILSPVQSTSTMKIYETPIKNHKYILTVDCAQGTGLDYSTISVIDITTYPYKQVATFKDNEISHLSFPQIIMQLGTKYNMAEVLIESNDIGNTILHILNYDIEYENIVKTFAGVMGKPILGQKTTIKTKSVGCSRIKDMVEGGLLIVQDIDTLNEFRHFSLSGQSYAADNGYHDDLVMGLVNFAYYASTPQFRMKYDENFTDEYRREYDEKIMETLAPLPIFSSNMVDVDAADIAWLKD